MPKFEIDQVILELGKLKKQKFYGRIEIKYDSGTIVQVIRQESLSPITERDVLKLKSS